MSLAFETETEHAGHLPPGAPCGALHDEWTAPTSPQQSFDFICDLSKWPLFRGYRPLPGIVEASLPSGESVGLGARIRVRNSDGSVHHETVVGFEAGRHYRVRMELAPPASYFLRSIEEAVDLEPFPGGTRGVRRFDTTPRSAVALPIAWLVGGVLLKKAVERHNLAVAEALGATRNP